MYNVILLDAEDGVIDSREADTLKEAKRIAKRMLADEYARSAETTHEAWGTYKAEIRRDGECVADYFRS